MSTRFLSIRRSARPSAAVPMSLLAVLALAVAAYPAQHASAQVVVTAVDRSTLTRAFSSVPSNPNQGDQQVDVNNALGPWIGGDAIGPGVGEEAGFGNAAAIVGQQTDVTSLRFTGLSTVSFDVSSQGSGSCEASTRSSYSVTFETAITTRADLQVMYQGAAGSRFCRLEREGGTVLIDAPADLTTSVTLTPGVYTFRTEISAGAACSGSCAQALNRYINFDLTFHSVCPADIGGQGGLAGQDGHLDNNDFVVFIDHFFNHHPLADRGVQGGLRGSDGLFDNNDFVVFIDDFFTGC